MVYTLLENSESPSSESNAKSDKVTYDKLELPDFAQKTVRVEEAYTFAAQNQGKVMYIACYCGCANMQHSDKLLQHNSLKDCYIRPDGSFEPHASACKVCNDITLEVKELFGKGYSLKEVRKTIDEKYSGRGVGKIHPYIIILYINRKVDIPLEEYI